MNYSASKLVLFITIVLIFNLSAVFTASAKSKYFAKEGLYLEVILPKNNIGGGFKGNTVLTDGDEVILIPKVIDNTGFGISLGTRFASIGSMEIGYINSQHDIEFLGAKGEADYNIINMDMKLHFSVVTPLQPFILLGVCFPWLTVKDGSSTYNKVADATFSGIGFNLGGGLAYYLSPRIFLDGRVIFRYLSYNNATGVSGTRKKIEDGLDGDGMDYNIGLGYTF